MSLIKFDKEELEIFKHYFLYIVIMILSYTNYHLFLLYREENNLRLQDAKESLKTYKDGYYETNHLLQNFLRYENPDMSSDTTANKRPLYWR